MSKKNIMDEPIIRPSLLKYFLEADPTKQEYSQYAAQFIAFSKLEKMLLLAKEYNIDMSKDDAWIKLSMCIADNFIPGFKVIDEKPKKAGRPNKWLDKEGVRLYALVEMKRMNNARLSIEKACEILVNDGMFLGISHKALASRYHELKENNLVLKPLLMMKDKSGMSKKDFIQAIIESFNITTEIKK